MTFQRVLSRNGLSEGGYGDAPRYWQPGVNTEPESDGILEVSAYRGAELRMKAEKAAMLAGDLRRLESDTVDEGTICKVIAANTGLDAGVVAAVLKEWIRL